MRISDWSSDVCSSDLTGLRRPLDRLAAAHRADETALALRLQLIAQARRVGARREAVDRQATISAALHRRGVARSREIPEHAVSLLQRAPFFLCYRQAVISNKLHRPAIGNICGETNR